LARAHRHQQERGNDDPEARLGSALILAATATIFGSGIAMAHPESEGDHPGGCIVTAEPGTVAVGQTFTVAGNFGGAEIYIVAGADASLPEDATPAATTPQGDSFSVEFTAEAADVGELTVWGILQGSECGDADMVTVTTVPNTAMDGTSDGVIWVGMAMVLAAAAVGAGRVMVARR
jgi:hypothetical protein